ncbi:hypothetical protein B1B04_18690 [Lysinibacillus sp. KCTC 33748]|uniref:hypothetical protein n=1 Tax=unclassified Lysinibacillus TaxID=2636778 RepID=UPI0009A88F56|nr:MULTISPECIES: hypothetical protein [unclassified Lysinibacillus]OXS70196.1 hypothetical protein B1B04_18690 [Lysinibacillus sp. KCTC 33748]SKC04324.1 hypothetical protein SAMN06295926_11924 [Lysinibacillus sp. AC-3]
MEIYIKVFENMEFFCNTKLIEIIKGVSQEECDDILDSRDSDEFSNKWMEVYAEVRKKLKNSTVDTWYIQKIESLRERTFKAIFEHSKSSDLAAYLSDDIALLLEALLCDINNSWLNGLWKEYCAGIIPCGKILLG